MLFKITFPNKKSTPVPAPGVRPVALGGPAPREGGDLLASGPASVNWCRAPVGLPQVEFYRFFDDPKRRRTNNDFSNLQKSTKMSESIGPGAPKVGFWNKNLYLWPPFWHRCFCYFRKLQKCEISEVYNAKRGSEPSQTQKFALIFFKFACFSQTPSKKPFWEGLNANLCSKV